MDNGQKITVVVRKRPLGKKELQKGETDIVDIRDTATVVVKEIKQKVDLTKYVEEHNFIYDLACDQNTTNEQLYQAAVRPIIEAAFNRAKVTCFAYGQTGSGKTHTMIGDADAGIPGLYLLASYDIFTLLSQPQFANIHVTISFYEIYCGKLYDLLNEKNPLPAREDAKGNVNIVGLCEKKITNAQQLMGIISQGQSARVTSSNSANSESSRSHALLQINLKQGKSIYGKLSFIDLAGSERGADVSDQNKQTRIDGAEINKSLLALKECIRALDLNKNHTPFRGSKLTQVLKDSFTGNCRTVMIGNISPSNNSSEHTLNTLRYADRVKELRKPQDGQMSQQDYNAKELGLARQNNNIVKKAYRNPDDEDDEEEEQYLNNNLQKFNQQGHQGLMKQQVQQPQQLQQSLLVQQQQQQQQYQQQQLQQQSQQSQQQMQMGYANQRINQNNQNKPPSTVQQQIVNQVQNKQPVLNNNNNNNQINPMITKFGNQMNSLMNNPIGMIQVPQINQNNQINPQVTQINQLSQQQNLMGQNNNINQQQNKQGSNFINNNNNNNISNNNNNQFNQNAMQQQRLQNNQQNYQNMNIQQQQQQQQQQNRGQQQYNPQQLAQQQQQQSQFPQQTQQQYVQSQQYSQQLPLQQYPPLNNNKQQNSLFSNQQLPQQYGPIVNNNYLGQITKNQPFPNLYAQNAQITDEEYPEPPRQMLQQNQFQLTNQEDVMINNQPMMENYMEYNNMNQQQPTQQQIELQKLSLEHEELVHIILQEEEEVVNGHREQIDKMVEITKEEMILLNKVDQPGSDISSYVQQLHKLLDNKLQFISSLKEKLNEFSNHLQEEEELSKKFYQQRQNIMQESDMDVHQQDDLQLLDNLDEQY